MDFFQVVQVSLDAGSKWAVALGGAALAASIAAYFLHQVVKRPRRFEEYPNDSLHTRLDALLTRRDVRPEVREEVWELIEAYGFERRDRRLGERYRDDVVREHDRTVRAERLLAIVAGIGGAGGIILTILNRTEIFDTLWKGIFGWMISTAYASDNRKADISALVPYFLSGILIIMALSFIGAVVVALTTQSTRQNTGRRKTADNIIKMAGSFFVGFGMALMKY